MGLAINLHSSSALSTQTLHSVGELTADSGFDVERESRVRLRGERAKQRDKNMGSGESQRAGPNTSVQPSLQHVKPAGIKPAETEGETYLKALVEFWR
jgi:hypothetical protein